MNTPLVTIVIPTFNRATMLRRCIDSALAQTQPCEIVVVDHGSSDDTPQVVRSFGDQVRYLRREQDHGVHFAWVDGVVSAQCEFVHFNFDDDYLEPTYIEKCMSLMAPDVGLVFSKVTVVDEGSGKVQCVLFERICGASGLYPASVFMNKQITGLVSPGATIIRRKDILNALFVGKVPFARHEYRGVGPDWLMTSMVTLDYPKIGFINEPLAIFSSHEGSITINALHDAKKKQALRCAYQESRKFYTLLWMVKFLRLDLLANVALVLFRIKGKLASALKRIFPRKPLNK